MPYTAMVAAISEDSQACDETNNKTYEMMCRIIETEEQNKGHMGLTEWFPYICPGKPVHPSDISCKCKYYPCRTNKNREAETIKKGWEKINSSIVGT